MTDEIMLTIGEDGKASLYDDTYDITIHCESQEEQDEVKRILQNVPHWIPVTERLPEKFDYYLVSGNNSVWFARYENGRFLGVLSGHALDTVIAWMPLPEPYKGVTE